MTPQEAGNRLKLLTQWDSPPGLTQDEIDALVVMAQRADADGNAPSSDDWAPTYALRAAAAEGWRMKAGKASSQFAFSEDGQSFQPQQVIEHCLKMAAHYSRGMAHSIPVQGAYTTAVEVEDV